MVRILINCLLAFTLILGVSPINAAPLHEQGERSAEPETPVEREEATARSRAIRKAPKRGVNHSFPELQAILITTVPAAKSIRSQTMPLALFVSQRNLHQRLGVFRI